MKVWYSVDSEQAYELLFSGREKHLNVLEQQITEVSEDRNQLVKSAISFLPRRTNYGVTSGHRCPREVGLISTAAGAAVLILGGLVKNAAYSTLPIFSLRSDNKELKPITGTVFKQ